VKVALGRMLNETGTKDNESNTPQRLVDAQGLLS
jgi:hypothetical protein